MWPLFLGIGVGFLLLLAYGWGLSTGVKLGKNQQAREQQALRALAHAALTAHERERLAWRERSGEAARAAGTDAEHEPPQAAEIAHDRTRRAFLALGAAWGDFGLPDEMPKNAANHGPSSKS